MTKEEIKEIVKEMFRTGELSIYVDVNREWDSRYATGEAGVYIGEEKIEQSYIDFSIHD